MQETQKMWFNPWDRKIPWRRKWQPTLVFLLENPMDRGAWWAAAYGVAQSRAGLKQLSSSNSSVQTSQLSIIALKPETFEMI